MNSARYLLVFGVILTLLCGIIPVSGYEGEVILDETFTDDLTYDYHVTKTNYEALSYKPDVFDRVKIHPVQNFKGNKVVIIETIINCQYGDMDSIGGDYVDIYYIGTNPEGSLNVHCGDGYFGYFKYSAYGSGFTKLYLHSDNFTIPKSVSDGHAVFQLVPKTKTMEETFGRGYQKREYVSYDYSSPVGGFVYRSAGNKLLAKSVNSLYVSSTWKNRLIVTEQTNTYNVSLLRYGYTGQIVITSDDQILDNDIGSYNRTNFYGKFLAPLEVGLQNPFSLNWFNRTIGLPPTPTPTPIPEPELTYIAKIEARDYHTNQILPDVHFLVVDFKKSETLYNEWVSAGFIEIPLEYRSYDDSHFPKQYGIRASKQGYYADDIIVSHWIKPYTFIIRMRDIYSEEPLDTSLITFHIRDRFSNNYIDTARLIITHYDKGEVFNQTVNGGIQSVRLPQTQPYDPQFDYNATVKADNYDDTVMGFSVYNDVDINIKMFPGEGTPGEGNAFIHFTVGYFDNNDIFRNIPGAKITIGAQSMYTNAAGYAQFELPDDNFYTYTAEHFEFETVSGSIMLQGSRTHNIIMHRHEVPTTPTAQPTFPGEEPADESYLDWMARNFARAFNLSLEGGKLFMGMIISLAIGMITAKKLNGGAAEFGIGMLGGMVLCILIGILPIWPIIALLLIVGLYIGMHIARGYTHGGR